MLASGSTGARDVSEFKKAPVDISVLSMIHKAASLDTSHAVNAETFVIGTVI